MSKENQDRSARRGSRAGRDLGSTAAGGRYKELRDRAELILRRERGTQAGLEKAQYGEAKRGELAGLLHELDVRMLELELQNEELQLAQERYRFTAEQYHELYHSAPVAYFVLDGRLKVLRVNRAGCALLNRQKRYILNNSILRYVAHSDIHQLDTYLHKQLLAGRDFRYDPIEVTLPMNDGETHRVSLNAVRHTAGREPDPTGAGPAQLTLPGAENALPRRPDLAHDETEAAGGAEKTTGRPAAAGALVEGGLRPTSFEDRTLLVSMLDITRETQLKQELEFYAAELEQRVERRTRELMEANKRAEASELRYRSLVERSPDGILVTRSGRIEFANRAAAALLGAGSREELVSQNAAELLTPASRERARNLLSLSGGGMFRTDLSLLRLDGREVQVEAAASVVYRSGKRAVQVVFRDITERKQLEDELALYQRQLRKLAAQVSRTAEAERNRAAGEFHDTVGQLLGLMQIKLDQLRAEGLDHAADRMVAELKSIADQAIEQTQTLTAELSPPVLRQLGLSPALEWLAENFCKRYGVACSFSGDDAPKNVPADKKMFLYQAARELVHNAVKHGAPSQVQITAGRLDHSLRVSVTDDGSGFDPAVLDHHVDQRGGFGLFSIKVRLEEWNGHFLVDSEPGKGTTVTMILPM